MIRDWRKSAEQTWTSKRNGITVTTTYCSHWTDVVKQIFIETITLDVNDHGRTQTFEHSADVKYIFPQEFHVLLQLNGQFEFLGWWKGNCNSWHLDQSLDDPNNLSGDNMVLLRRT